MYQEETAQQRFDRKWLQQLDDRKPRGWDQRGDERNDREFVPHVDPDKGQPDIPEIYTEMYMENY